MRQDAGFSFSQVPSINIPRSTFDRSHGHKTTFNAGYLIPFLVDEALPGDTFNARASIFARMATPVAPLMDNLQLDAFFFAVPNRLLWSNWQRFCGEQPDPGDSTDFVVPVVNSGELGFDAGSIFDYFGIPPGVPNLAVNALYARAYNLIWNEWFRDENLQTRATVSKGEGPDGSASYPLRRRGKRHDYFTSCLPWPQKGEALTLSFGGTAPVQIVATGDQTPKFLQPGIGYGPLNVDTATTKVDHIQNSSGFRADLEWHDPALTGVADLTEATAQTINQIREAFQIQRLLERDARGGTRYTEILRSHFGVTSPDQRLQRPEYLGGGSIPVNINPVTQTSSTDATTPQGNLAGFGVVSGTVGFSKSFTEHCIVVGLCMVRGEISYQQGVPRQFSRRTRYDYYWPALAHLGEQAVLNREIYATGGPGDEDVFGYQERWAEYRYAPSKITGVFRSTHATPLDFWHIGQEFEALPTLGDTFIQENPPIERVVAVTDEPHFLFDSFIKLKCTRPMPTYSVPGLMDHF